MSKVEEKTIKKQAPKLFSLSSLQQKLSKDYKISFNDSLEIIQKLYEKGFITYPRTNTEYLAENEKDKVKKLIEAFSANHDVIFKDSNAIFDDSKIESHSAIIPTLKKPDNTSFQNDLERSIYQVILFRFLARFTREETLVNELSIIFSVGQESFSFKGERVIQKGFLAYEQIKIKNELPYLKESDAYEVRFELKEKFTEPPKKITEERLSNYLKNPFKNEDDEKEDYEAILKGLEIGTVATRTAIIENAKKYGYIVQNKQQFSITEKGIRFIESLDKLGINLYKEKTVELSMVLKKIYNNQYQTGQLLKDVEANLREIVKKDVEIKKYQDPVESLGKCPRCGKEIGKNKKAYYCTGYKDGCRFCLWIDNAFFSNKGHNLTDARVKSLLSGKSITLKNCKSQKSDNTYDMKIVLKDDGKKTQFEGSFLNKK